MQELIDIVTEVYQKSLKKIIRCGIAFWEKECMVVMR